jgi:spore protease
MGKILEKKKRGCLMQTEKRSFSPRTDLAIEIGAQLQNERTDTSLEGIKIITKEHETYPITTTHVKILDEKGAQLMGKPIGNYFTTECVMMQENAPEAHQAIIGILAEQLQLLLRQFRAEKVLVVGLGNRFATPDRLGPDVSGKVLVTRHLHAQAPEALKGELHELSSLTPGVMGLTGIETSEIIKGVVQHVKPDCIIAIDALGARHIERVNTTIQMSDTGISPGAGVGNKRKQITKEHIGVPVIAIGVPTVVDAVTLVNDTLDELLKNMLEHTESKPFYKMLETLSEAEKRTMIEEVLLPNMGNMFVTPKDIDETMGYLSEIITNAINIAVHPGIELSDINKYTY